MRKTETFPQLHADKNDYHSVPLPKILHAARIHYEGESKTKIAFEDVLMTSA